MLRLLIFRFRRRRALSTMIGGVIILSLLITALGTMVFVSQQYDQYQQSVNKMAQYDSQRLSEYLAFNSPGLTFLTSDAVSGWGSGCTTTYNCYNLTVSNLGGVGVQIVRIYINSTRSGCTPLCVLNPTSSINSYAFNLANSFLNPGEVNHWLVLALPSAVALPNPNPAFPQNTILVATTRGNVFSFQWPYQIQFFGQSSSAFSSGLLKVAYQKITSSGYDSKNEWGPVAGGSGGTTTSAYCHHEPLQAYPAASNYAEKLTVSGLSDNNLYFVNPWVTKTILMSTCTDSCSGSTTTQMYIYAVVINTFKTPYTVNNGTIDLTWYSTNHIDGVLYGLYYQGHFYRTGSLPSIAPGTSYYVIYQINQIQMAYPPPRSPITDNSVMFWGGASLSTTSKDQTYFSGTILASGLWMRASC
jgi:hypothetical protein